MKGTSGPPVLACRWRGHDNRFFGKYKADNGKWLKIPGGAYPPEIDTRPKALACARRWYEVDVASRATTGQATGIAPRSWTEVCDAFLGEVAERVRGADSSKDEAKKRCKWLRRSALLATQPITDHDDALALRWLRETLKEPKKKSTDPRDAFTVRNIARILGGIYRFARSKGWFPKDRRLPTESDEFKAEVSGALKEKAKLGKVARVGCPIETVRAVVHCASVTPLRRLMTRTACLTGIGPGELHGLQVRDYGQQNGTTRFDVQRQWTLGRGKECPARTAPLKTVWRRRRIPVHHSLIPHVDHWIAQGWEHYVGRKPTPDDYLFPAPDGSPFREERAHDFLADVARAGCSITHQGITLDIYSLRHTFATLARRSGLSSDARDRLLGHRPRDTKALHYEDEDLPLLAEEVAKIPDALDPAPAAQGGQTGGPPLVPDAVEDDELPSQKPGISAEEKGFEPSDDLRRRRFSKPLP